MDINLRFATKEDCENVYKWRNHEAVVNNSIQQKAFSYDAHQKWFENILQSTNSILLLGEYQNDIIGVLRFDLIVDVAEVSIYLTPNYIGKGYGAHLLNAAEKWIRDNKTEVKHLKAKIRSENIRSQKVFVKAGYNPYLLELQKEL